MSTLTTFPRLHAVHEIADTLGAGWDQISSIRTQRLNKKNLSVAVGLADFRVTLTERAIDYSAAEPMRQGMIASSIRPATERRRD